jgi:pyruvate,water dikinase
VTDIETRAETGIGSGDRAGRPAVIDLRDHATAAPLVVDLTDVRATDVALTGGKAAALAAVIDRLDVLPGVVLTTAFTAAVDAGADLATHPAVRAAFLAAGGQHRSLVARSSSVVEDTAASSMAGQFDSVIGIDGFDHFVAAVETVIGSRVRAGATDHPIAVLVQPLLEPAFGGVLFGVDPVTGRADRRVVAVVRGGPEPLVSGAVDGSRYLLDPAGRLVHEQQDGDVALRRADLRRLAALSNRVEAAFGGPQDVEWAIDVDGRLVLLQARPVTTEVRGTPSGPVYGPGPVAETFPEALTALEADLWVPPLREAVGEAVVLAGAATPKDVAASSVVVSVGGRVAIDLRLAGDLPQPRGLLRKLDPRPGARQLRAAWRVGRLRAALPALGWHLLERVDADLAAVPALDELTDRQLLALLHRSGAALRSLHAHETLVGLLTDTRANRLTGASVAMRVLAEARRDGLADAEILERSPVVLTLVPPRVAPSPALPPEVTALGGADLAGGTDDGVLREALRLRVRWVQELAGRAAWALGERLAAAGALPEPELVRHLHLDDLDAVVAGRASVVPALVEAEPGPPLPARFQLSDLGRPIRTAAAGEPGGGTGAGGGSGRGPVTHDAEDPPPGSVLVTTTLTPGLGPLLARLEGIVAETGSVLSHLAILAREAGVPTVVGYDRATEELPEGAVVEVDGETGRVTIEDGGPS